MSSVRTWSVILVTLAVAVSSAAAQPVASALVREGQTLPGAPGETVDSINNSAVNHAGGYAFTVNTSGSGTTLSHAWGHATGGPGTVLRTETTVGDFVQLSYESFFGISDTGQVAYSPNCTNTSSGSTGLDTVWLDATLVAAEEEVYPHAGGLWWSFGSRPGVTADGAPYFAGGVTTTQGGATTNRGLFYGLTGAPVLLGGDILPGLPFALSTSSTVTFDYRFSALGTHYLVEVGMNSGSIANDNAMVMDGQGLMLGGSLVREDSQLPASIGGLANERWDNFDSLSITEDGHWLLTGDSTASTLVDEFLIVDGQIILRESDTLPSGHVLVGAISGAYMNEDGDWAVLWNTDLEAVTRECLIVNGELMLAETYNVDWDGDGLPDANAELVDVTGIATLTVGDRWANGAFEVYFTGDVSVDGGPLVEGGFVLRIPGLGDLNCDGSLNGLDIDPFVLALTSTPPDYPEYYAQHPYCDVMLADTDLNGSINGLDIDPFVDLLTGG